MKNDFTIRIEWLLIKKGMNRLTDDEKEELENLLNQYPEAISLQQSVEAALKNKNSRPIQQISDPVATWPEMNQKIHQRQNRKIISIRWMAAAAVIAVVGIGSIFSWQRFGSRPNNTISKVGSSINTGVRLQLANGQSVFLNQTKAQNIIVGSATATASSAAMSLQASGTSSANRPVEWNTLQVPAIMEYSITLPDGSMVRLNSVTKLRFPSSFAENSREVYIEGEAYFSVAKAANQPFIVHTPQGDIQVLGTEFNVNTYTKGILKAALVSGAIAYTKGKDSVRLQPGNQVIAQGDEYRVAGFDRGNTLSWMKGICFFHNTSLSEISDLVTRWYDVPVIIDNPGLAVQPFTGSLDKSKPLNAFLVAIQNTFNASYYYEGNVLHISN